MRIFCGKMRAPRGVKIAALVALLALLVFYVLPKLLLELWFFAPEEQELRERNGYPQPMRVEADGANVGFFREATGKAASDVELMKR